MSEAAALRGVLTQLQITSLACAQLEGQLRSSQAEQFQRYAERRVRGDDAHIDGVWTAIASEVGDYAPAIAARLSQMDEYVRSMIDELVERTPEAKASIAACAHEARKEFEPAAAVTIREQLDSVLRRFDRAKRIYARFTVSEADVHRWALVARTRAFDELSHDEYGVVLASRQRANNERLNANEYARLARQRRAKLRAEAEAHQAKMNRAYDQQMNEWRQKDSNYQVEMSAWRPKNREWNRRAKKALEERQSLSSRIKAIGDQQKLTHWSAVISFRASLILAFLLIVTIAPLLFLGWLTAAGFVGGPLSILAVLALCRWRKLDENSDELTSELKESRQRLRELDTIVLTMATEKPAEPVPPVKPRRPNGYPANSAAAAVFGDRG